MVIKTLHANILLVFVISAVGLWGCAQAGPDARTAAAKIRQLETRNTKLEEDYRSSVADVNLLRKKLAEAEKQFEDVSKQNQDLQNNIKDREELQQKLTTSVGERDALRVQINSFSKELQSLSTRVQQVAGTLKAPDFISTVSQEK
jgi:chromosome segregation ATPase